MSVTRLYSEKDIARYLSTRPGEIKLGQRLKVLGSLEDLEKTTAQFVIFGIPEDVGVRANYGRAGTATAWNEFLKAFLNVQDNEFNSGENIVLLGEINTSEIMQKAGNIDALDPNYTQKLGDLVVQLDKMVSELVNKIILAGKFPVIIGGGHNNAYGNLKGAAEAFDQRINVLNIDAHTDLREPDYRHSGNGFSYAFKNGFLKRYSVFGLQKNYTPQYIFEAMRESDAIQFSLLEELPRENRTLNFKEHLNYVKEDRFGLELDCDAIENFPSSAIAPVGLSLEEIRILLQEVAKEEKCCYLHICEAVASPHFTTGKALSYFVTDFIRQKTYA